MSETKRLSNNKIRHVHAVAEYMYQHAEEHGLNKDDMYVLGLMHDIGYIRGRTGHLKNGGEIAENVGINEKLVYAIENHGMNLSELEFVTQELILLVRADLQINHLGEHVGYDMRLNNVRLHYGESSTQYKRVLGTIDYLKQNGWYR